MQRFITLVSLLAVFAMLLASCGGGEDDDAPTATSPAGATPTEQASTDATPTVEEAEPTEPSEPKATEEPQATATPEPTGPVSVEALWFSFDGVTASGGTSQVRVNVEENTADEVRVGFFESEVGGTGPQWRTSGWMSVITASLLLGFSPSDYEFSFDVAGRIDGPSAGALMTAAVLAGFLDDEIDPTITMTGTINPDGTIGPVGGIPHKIQGAAEAGKTTVLVPAGQRFDWDYAAQQSVDLVQVGQQHGVEVVLVPDIYTAYEILTGAQLPAVESAGTASMPPNAFDKYRAGTTDWLARYQEERAKFTALPVEVQDYRVDVITLADDLIAQADQFLTEGQVARAYELAWEAAAIVKVGTQAAELDNLYLTGGIEPMVGRLQSTTASETRLSALVQKLEAQTPRTATDTLALVDAAAGLSVAQGLLFQANDALATLEQSEYTEDDILTAIYTAAFNYALADFYLEGADDAMSIGVGFGSAPAPSLEVLQAMSETFRRGADSNIAYFDALIIDPWAADNGVSSDIAKYVFMESDDTYLTAVAAVSGAQSLVDSMRKPEAQAIMWLGASLVGYNQSAVVIAEYYSLDARIDEFGTVVEYGRQTALADMLDLADQRSEAWLNSVAGEDPVPALFYYDNARLQRQGDAFDQLGALSNYWHAAVLSEVLAIFIASGQ